jgi:hypothetical protein
MCAAARLIVAKWLLPACPTHSERGIERERDIERDRERDN